MLVGNKTDLADKRYVVTADSDVSTGITFYLFTFLLYISFEVLAPWQPLCAKCQSVSLQERLEHNTSRTKHDKNVRPTPQAPLHSDDLIRCRSVLLNESVY